MTTRARQFDARGQGRRAPRDPRDPRVPRQQRAGHGLRGWSALLLLCGLAAAGCRTRLAPGPMRFGGEPPPTPERGFDTPEVTVLRHADPVRVRRPGAVAAYDLRFYRKRDRIGPGGAVVSGAGGRAEILWPGETTSVLFSEEGVVEIGDPSRNEPAVRFRRVSHAKVHLAADVRVALPGGAELYGDAAQPSGPFLVDERNEGLLRITNASRAPAELFVRDRVLEIATGESVDLPIMQDSAPVVPRESGAVAGPARDAVAGGIEMRLSGAASAAEGEEGWQARVVAEGEGAVSALGVRVRLAPGGEAVLSRLAPRSQARSSRENAPGSSSEAPTAEGEGAQEP